MCLPDFPPPHVPAWQGRDAASGSGQNTGARRPRIAEAPCRPPLCYLAAVAPLCRWCARRDILRMRLSGCVQALSLLACPRSSAVEQLTRNEQAVGSNPTVGSSCVRRYAPPVTEPAAFSCCRHETLCTVHLERLASPHVLARRPVPRLATTPPLHHRYARAATLTGIETRRTITAAGASGKKE